MREEKGRNGKKSRMPCRRSPQRAASFTPPPLTAISPPNRARHPLRPRFLSSIAPSWAPMMQAETPRPVVAKQKDTGSDFKACGYQAKSYGASPPESVKCGFALKGKPSPSSSLERAFRREPSSNKRYLDWVCCKRNRSRWREMGRRVSHSANGAWRQRRAYCHNMSNRVHESFEAPVVPSCCLPLFCPTLEHLLSSASASSVEPSGDQSICLKKFEHRARAAARKRHRDNSVVGAWGPRRDTEKQRGRPLFARSSPRARLQSASLSYAQAPNRTTLVVTLVEQTAWCLGAPRATAHTCFWWAVRSQQPGRDAWVGDPVHHRFQTAWIASLSHQNQGHPLCPARPGPAPSTCAATESGRRRPPRARAAGGATRRAERRREKAKRISVGSVWEALQCRAKEFYIRGNFHCCFEIMRAVESAR